MNIYPPDWWPKIIAIDWGYRHGNYVGWGTVSPQKELILYRDFLCNFTSIKKWGAEARKLSQNDGNIVRVVCDPSAWGERGEDKNLIDQIMDATGWNIEKATNDRIGGKNLMHELFRWLPRPKKFDAKQGFDNDLAQRLLRMKGTEAYQAYVNDYLADNTEELLPKCKIVNTCNPTIDAIQACVYDEGTGNNRLNAEDVKKQDGDDPYDGFRYLTKAWEQFIDEVSHEWLRRCEYEEVMREFQRTGDYMTYDNRLTKLDNTYKLLPISRDVRIRKHTRLVRH